jgi:hypothetical protein
MKEMTWDEFERHLVEDAGWDPTEARQERLAQELGDLGDVDGDADPFAG